MSLGRTLLLKAADTPWIAKQISERAFAKRAVRRFMPGETLDDALAAAKALQAERQDTLITQLGEAIVDLGQAEAVRDHYLAAFETIKARGLATHVSVKPTQLGIDQSLDHCRGYLIELAAAAKRTGSALWIDMEDHRYVDRTIDLYRSIKAVDDRSGLAVQAYLYRSAKDIDALLDLAPWIRLVKGAYREPPSVAYPAKRDVDLSFYDLSIKLLTGAAKGQGTPVFGTHDISLVRRIIAKAKELGVKQGGYEIHMLYGIKAGEQGQLVREGETVKTLISYGSAWFKWYMRRLAERPANLWFVMKSMAG
ncbi:MAG: proline dehydrogenase [Gemmatimonadetes bacterium]|nr:proline dehydrogenase [Gemmatimonadota bacterium]